MLNMLNSMQHTFLRS